MPDTTRGTEARGAGMQEGMAEATRLTRAGRLEEATALIQRTLGGGISPGAFAPPAQRAARSTAPIALPGALAGGVSPVIEREPARVRAPEAPSTAGRFVAGSFTNRAGTRAAYRLYVPSGAVGKAMPLVVMLHGCTQNAEDLAAGTRMNELAESGGFLVVYPEQSAKANGQRRWNWFKAEDQQREMGEPSIIAGITRQVAATQHVDTRRIYVAGMSAGGAMAVVMGATYPDLYAAVGVHSGLAYGAAHDMPSAFIAMKQGAPDPAQGKTQAAHEAEAVDLSRAVPTIVFHGDRDGTVNPRNGEQVLRAGDGAPGPGLGRTRVHPLRLPRRGWAGCYGALDRARSRPRLVGREPARLVHRPPRPRRLGRDGALFHGELARLGRPDRERDGGAREHEQCRCVEGGAVRTGRVRGQREEEGGAEPRHPRGGDYARVDSADVP
jgi:poly(hydroxyalkanoate) depolymerase family esterase